MLIDSGITTTIILSRELSPCRGLGCGGGGGGGGGGIACVHDPESYTG